MAKYCERMEDRSMASDLYSEAVELMDRLGMDELMVWHFRIKLVLYISIKPESSLFFNGMNCNISL